MLFLSINDLSFCPQMIYGIKTKEFGGRKNMHPEIH